LKSSFKLKDGKRVANDGEKRRLFKSMSTENLNKEHEERTFSSDEERAQIAKAAFRTDNKGSVKSLLSVDSVLSVEKTGELEENGEDVNEASVLVNIMKQLLLVTVLIIIPAFNVASLVVLPIMFTFRPFMPESEQRPFLQLLLFVDIWYCVHILCQFIWPYRDPETKIRVTSIVGIAQNYFKSGTMVNDIVGVLPWELLSNWLVFVKVIARVRKLEWSFDLMEHKASINPAIFRILRLMLRILTICHMFACCWHEVAMIQYHQVGKCWLVSYNILHDSVWTKYISSLYWTSTTIISVGYGDISAQGSQEMIFSIFAEIVGAVCFGYIIANISGLWEMLDVKTAFKVQRLQEVKAYLRSTKLPKDLESRILSHFEYFLERKRLYIICFMYVYI
jgi:hypothetical protein